jgi:aspartate/glutamate racemase
MPVLFRQKKKKTILINMIYESSRRCLEHGYNNVCLLCTAGTLKADLFGDFFFNMGIDAIYPDRVTLDFLTDFIKDVKCGKNPDISTLEQRVKSIKCDAFLLGCTELSYALHVSKSPALTYVDSLSCLARKTLEVFGKKTRLIPFT